MVGDLQPNPMLPQCPGLQWCQNGHCILWGKGSTQRSPQCKGTSASPLAGLILSLVCLPLPSSILPYLPLALGNLSTGWWKNLPLGTPIVHLLGAKWPGCIASASGKVHFDDTQYWQHFPVKQWQQARRTPFQMVKGELYLVAG